MTLNIHNRISYLIRLFISLFLMTLTSEADELSDFDALISDELLGNEQTEKGYFTNSYINITSVIKNEAFTSDDDNNYEDYLTASYNRYRLTYDNNHESIYIIHSEIDNIAVISNYTDTVLFEKTFNPEHYNQLFNLDLSFYPGDFLYYSLKLHRFYIKYNTERTSTTTGRQVVSSGSGKLWNPLDILNPISPYSIEGVDGLDGVDSVKFEYYPSDTSEFSFVYAPKRINNSLDGTVFFNENTDVMFRYKKGFNFFETAIMAGRAGRKNILGLDFLSIVRGGMIRGALLYADQDDYTNYIVANAGYEYTFQFGLNLIIEFFYNENALNRNPDFKAVYTDGFINGIHEDNYAYFASQLITLNRYYSGIYLDYQITPLITSKLFFMYDFEGKGFYAAPEISYSIKQDMDISCMVRLAESDKDSDFYEYEKNPNILMTFEWHF